MEKLAFIGAGSLQFTTSCMRDLLTFDAFKDAEFALMDINKSNPEKPCIWIRFRRLCARLMRSKECATSFLRSTRTI